MSLQSSTLPPAQPSYVLRGHTAQVHAVRFFRQGTRLLTGDADGWLVVWDVPIKRPVAVWQAHSKTILGVGVWGEDEEKIITHGRDNKLHVWHLPVASELSLFTALPIDSTTHHQQPWLLHSLDVNALNFCSFASCILPNTNELYIAVPGINDGAITITCLPSESRVAAIPPPAGVNVGMLMAVRLHLEGEEVRVIAGHESGHVAIWQRTTQWTITYLAQPHAQPVLSVDLAPATGFFFSSSADAVIARHPLRIGEAEMRILKTKHAGQQSLVVRSDEKIFATAGWDGRMRVYAVKGMKELAVLKWHKEGCYAVAFAGILDEEERVGERKSVETAGRGQDDASAGVVRDGGALVFAANDGEVIAARPTVSSQRLERAKKTHWLAAGSKDGKVSLWEIY